MAKNKNLKKAIVASALAVTLSTSMLVGTTFAWFTDSATSSGNVIKAGTLDVTLEHKDSYADTTWKDSTKGAIFDYDNWEPGYTQVKYVKIENVGSLDMKFKLDIIPNILPAAGKPNLADVIDMYIVNLADLTAAPTRADLIKPENQCGTLTAMMNNPDGAAYGKLPAGEKIEVAIALKMRESVGNEYQGLSVGEGFTVRLLAVQVDSESDSFDNTYDAGIEFDINQAIPVAKVEYLTDLINTSTAGLNWNTSYSMVNGASGVEFETAYKFTAPVDGDEAAKSPYASWLCDFAVSFNRDVTPEDEVGIAGEYGSWGWIGFLANQEMFDTFEISKLDANTAYNLLESYTGGSVYMDYEDICGFVKEFQCAAWAGANASDLTITVELRLYETYSKEESVNHEPNIGTASANKKTGKYITIATYSHSFDNK